jgi:hypothetical protein
MVEKILKRFEEEVSKLVMILGTVNLRIYAHVISYNFRNSKNYCVLKGRNRNNGKNKTCTVGCHLMLLGYPLIVLHPLILDYCTHDQHPLT